MNYCLRCNKPCSNLGSSGSEPSVFCDECRAILRKRLQPGQQVEMARDIDLLDTALWQEEDHTASAALAQAGDEEKLASSTGDAIERRPAFGTFARWRAQEAFAVKPFVENSSETALAVHAPHINLQTAEVDTQVERLQSPVTPLPIASEAGQCPRLDQANARPEREEESSKNFTWSDLADPLMARIETYKFPSPTIEEGIGDRNSRLANTILTTAQRGRRESPRVAFVIVAVLIVLALVVGGAVAAMPVFQTQQDNARAPNPSPVLTATTDATQLPSATAQTELTSLPISSAGVGQPTATAATIPETTVPGTTTSGTTVPGASVPGTSASGTATPGVATPQSQAPIEGISSSTLTFSAVQGQANPASQAIKIANTGGAPLNWTASVDAGWLSTSPGRGTVAAGQTGQTAMQVDIGSLAPGSYNAKVTINAADNSGAQVQGSPQVVSVALTVAQPCTLQVTPSSLTFTTSTVPTNSSGEQKVTLTETGKCGFPISWKASADQNWIILSATSGTDNGSGSTIKVSVKANLLQGGQQTGHITISAIDKNGTSLVDGSQIVLVTMDAGCTKSLLGSTCL